MLSINSEILLFDASKLGCLNLVKGTKFGSFRSKSFPTVEDFVTEIGALKWFDDDYATKTNERSVLKGNIS